MFLIKEAVALLSLPVVLAAPILEVISDIPIRSDSQWEDFKSARTGFLVQLAEPIEDCWSRNATYLPGYVSPMFHTCVDWHSAVHAAYSLYAITEASGDERYKDIAEAVVHNDKVPAEMEYMNEAHIGDITFFDFEVPYGMAWMFNLVAQRREILGDDGLRPIADLAAEKSREFLLSLSDEEIKAYLRSAAHINLSWGMIHLARWARYTENEDMQRDVEETYLSAAMDPLWDQECPAAADSSTDYEEFFPPCLLRIAGIIQMWNDTSEALQTWVEERIPSDFNIPPVTEITSESGHRFAINFSRAYALWYVYQATGNTAFRDNYAELITYQMSRPDFWNIEAGYGASHFVPQFGVRAIEASKEGEDSVYQRNLAML
jgi:hypothetical protein